jgi:hypothetical protein
VNWLRTKARYDRWNEELIIVTHEMRWALAWFARQESEWSRRALWAEMQHMSGHKCYAETQIIKWRRMHRTALESWDSILKHAP